MDWAPYVLGHQQLTLMEDGAPIHTSQVLRSFTTLSLLSYRAGLCRIRCSNLPYHSRTLWVANWAGELSGRRGCSVVAITRHLQSSAEEDRLNLTRSRVQSPATPSFPRSGRPCAYHPAFLRGAQRTGQVAEERMSDSELFRLSSFEARLHSTARPSLLMLPILLSHITFLLIQTAGQGRLLDRPAQFPFWESFVWTKIPGNGE
ncbi:hypothetical protein O181_024414 [Austropuccinia psidii MF-1]|uniref:Uncharacterized protein n=1 Tax=Austropuccinia psidii MF-1 TaxID=1389203 RepID=A0A9Q3CIL9_9BASI|nr:hypothetical protein [Austropuccinia psidii MF-1]